MVKMKNTENKITEALNQKADSSNNEQKFDEVKKEAKESDTVVVACGIPMGLKLEPSSGTVILKGMPVSHIVSSIKGVGFLPAGKYGLTTLPKSVWEEIKEKYKSYDFIQNGIVFATETTEETVEKAVENSEKKLGFEQADPEKGRTKKTKDEE